MAVLLQQREESFIKCDPWKEGHTGLATFNLALEPPQCPWLSSASMVRSRPVSPRMWTAESPVEPLVHLGHASPGTARPVDCLLESQRAEAFSLQ